MRTINECRQSLTISNMFTAITYLCAASILFIILPKLTDVFNICTIAAVTKRQYFTNIFYLAGVVIVLSFSLACRYIQSKSVFQHICCKFTIKKTLFFLLILCFIIKSIWV